MRKSLIDRLDASIAAKSLLDHPFYQDWSAGKLTLEDLRHYAVQYYHFESNFPTMLSAIHSHCPVPQVRQDILDNLWDEEHGPRNHPALWLQFCQALGLPRETVLEGKVYPETHALVDTLSSIASSRPFTQGLAAIYAYERQVPAIAEKKLEGLASFYGIQEPEEVEFFTLHMGLDVDHAEAEAKAISQHVQTSKQEEEVESALADSLEALWRFLDGVYTRCQGVAVRG